MSDDVRKLGRHIDSRRPFARRMVSILACTTLLVLPSAGVGMAKAKDECTPRDAWTETIPAQGEKWIEVKNPRYRPAVEEVSHWVKHDAVTEVQRGGWHNFSPNQDQGPLEGVPIFPEDPRGTWQHENKPIPEGHWKKIHGAAGVYSTSEGNGNASWFYYEGDQTVVVKEAWEEKVIDQKYVPAKGKPTVWVKNLKYVPEKTVEHPAVTCTPEDPPADDQPVDKEPVKDQPVKDQPAKEQPKAPISRPVVEVTG